MNGLITFSDIKYKKYILIGVVVLFIISFCIGFFTTIMQQKSSHPVILIKATELVAFDAETGKESIFYKITDGRFLSAKWSPDRTKLAYLRVISNSCKDEQANIAWSRCTYVAYELGYLTKDKKETIIYTLPGDASISNFPIIYDWQDSSALIYAVNNYNPSNKAYGSKEFESNYDKKFFRFDVASNQSSSIKTIRTDDLSSIAFQVRGENIYHVDSYSKKDAFINKFPLENPSKTETIPGAEANKIHGFAISPDETSVLFHDSKDNVTLINQEPVKVLEDKPENINRYYGKSDFSSDGKYIAIVAFDSAGFNSGPFYFLTIIDAAGNKLAEIDSHAMEKLISNLPSYKRVEDLFFSFSPDGKKIFFVVNFLSFENKIYGTGKYAFMADANGENLEKVEIAESGWSTQGPTSNYYVYDGILGVAW